MRLEDCLAPAKVNLFLHVIGQRSDGYHLLQTAFRLLDWGDRLDFSLRRDGGVRRITEVMDVPLEDDLVIQAARLLQISTGTLLGADIAVHKVLPIGGGVGGGSSDAATTLIALNRLWGLNLTRVELQNIGLKLGADVPFFIYGRDAFAEGVGNVFQPLLLEKTHYIVIYPGVHVSTTTIFSSQELTRDSVPIKITDFAASATRNDLQAVVCKRYPEVAQAIDWLSQYAPARMTGSGACVFAEMATKKEVLDIIGKCPSQWQAWHAESMEQHPLYGWVA